MSRCVRRCAVWRPWESLVLRRARAGFSGLFSRASCQRALVYARTGRQQPSDLNEIRICLETNFLIHAIRTLKPEDLDELQHIAEVMIERAEAGEPWHDLDQKFHRKLFFDHSQ